MLRASGEASGIQDAGLTCTNGPHGRLPKLSDGKLIEVTQDGERSRSGPEAGALNANDKHETAEYDATGSEGG